MTPKHRSSAFRFRPLRCAIAISLALASLSAAAQTAEQNAAVADAGATRAWNLPAAPLADTLARIARDSGRRLSADPTLVAGKTAAPVRGNLIAIDAARQALAGTGLELVVTEGGTLSVQPAPGRAKDGEATLAPVAVTAQVLRSATTEGTGSYTARAVTIGKGERTLKETPQAISVITRQMMDDQNLHTINEVMGKTPGIVVNASPLGGQYFYSRGFKMDAPYQFDGVPLDVGLGEPQAASMAAEMAFYDRVEFLRGAAGMMQGAGTPSGAINLVRKRGLNKATTTVTASAGSWDNYRAQVDAGGPLNAAGTLRGRAVLAKQSRHSFLDLEQRDDVIAYGALDYDFSPDTTAGVALAYEKFDATPCWHGLPRYGNGSDLKLPRSTCLGQSWNHWDSERTTLFADFRHQINSNWSLKLASVHSRNDQRMKYSFVEQSNGVALGSTASPLTIYAGVFDYDRTDYGIDGHLNGKFEAFGRQHELTIGFNASRKKNDDLFALMIMSGVTNDVFNPNHHLAEPDDSTIVANSYRGGWPYPNQVALKQHGAYANLRLKLADPLTAVLGGRVSHYENDSSNKAWGSTSTTHIKESGKFTPFAALLYDLTPNLTAYASHADIFQPQSNLDPDGNVLPPKTGKNLELGIKGEWFDGALNGSFNLFRAYQEHAAAAVDSSLCKASSSCSVDTGKVRAQGLEAEISGSPIKRLQLLAGYTYTQTKTLSAMRNVNTAASNGTIYNSLVSRHMLRAWADYQLPGGLHDWSVGGGVTAQSGTYRVYSAIKLAQQGYALWNARVQYRIDPRWTAALNVSNLFDKRYYQTVGYTTSGDYYGAPRNWTLSLRGTF